MNNLILSSLGNLYYLDKIILNYGVYKMLIILDSFSQIRHLEMLLYCL